LSNILYLFINFESKLTFLATNFSSSSSASPSSTPPSTEKKAGELKIAQEAEEKKRKEAEEKKKREDEHKARKALEQKNMWVSILQSDLLKIAHVEKILKKLEVEGGPVEQNRLVFIWFLSPHLKSFIVKAFELWQRQVCRHIAVLVSVQKAHSMQFLLDNINIVVGILTNLAPMSGFLARSWQDFASLSPSPGLVGLLRKFEMQLPEIERSILSDLSGCFATMLQHDSQGTMIQFFHMCSGINEKSDPKVPQDFQNVIDAAVKAAPTTEEDFDTLQRRIEWTKSISDLQEKFDLKPQNITLGTSTDKVEAQYLAMALQRTDVPVSSTYRQVLDKLKSTSDASLAWLYGARSVLFRLYAPQEPKKLLTETQALAKLAKRK